MINPSKPLIAGNESYVAFTYDATTKKTTVYLDGENTGSGTTITVEPYQVEAIAKDIRNYIGRTQWWDTSVAGDNKDRKSVV